MQVDVGLGPLAPRCEEYRSHVLEQGRLKHAGNVEQVEDEANTDHENVDEARNLRYERNEVINCSCTYSVLIC